MDGVRFKTRRINIWNSATIDIEVDDGVKVVDFSKAENTVELRSVKKQFPSVETLIIGKSTSILEISNFMFPNVKEIISEDNQNFKSGNVLIKHDYSGFKLLNTFCKQADEVIDLQDVISISNYAFEGCLSKNIINIKLQYTEQYAFHGYPYMASVEYVSGVYCVGNICLSIDEDADVVEIPKNVESVVISEDFSGSTKIKCNKLIINNAKTLESCSYVTGLSCDTICIAYGGYIDTNRLNIMESKCFEVVGNNRYTTRDGFLYDYSGKMLLLCPKLRGGKITIPDKTRYIAKIAFRNNLNITELILPDSLTFIGEQAFSGCKALSSIDFGKGLSQIGDSARNKFVFSDCHELKKLHIPSNIKSIGSSAFSNCSSLQEIIFDEGVEIIDESAFSWCESAKTIAFPESLRYVYQNAFSKASKIIAKDYLPDGLFNAAFVADTPSENNMYDIVEITDGKYKLFLPRYLGRNAIDDYAHDFYLARFSDIASKDSYENKILNYISLVPLKQNLSILLYGYNHDKDLGTYLRRAASSIIQRFVNNDDDERLVEFLRFGLTSANTLGKFQKNMNPEKMPLSSAYILNEINKAGSKKSNAFRI